MTHSFEFPFCDGIRWLSVDDLILLNQNLIEQISPSETSGTLNRSLLESAQARPAQHQYYEQRSDIIWLTAILLIGICENHPFHNANKRTAFAAARMMLFINGYIFDPTNDEVISVMREIAIGEDVAFRDPEMLSSWIADNTRPADLGELPIERAQEFFDRHVAPPMKCRESSA